jgi:hypothetical protein
MPAGEENPTATELAGELVPSGVLGLRAAGGGEPDVGLVHDS